MKPLRSRFISFLLLISVFALPRGLLARSVPIVEKGILDLRNWQFGEQGPIRLDGEWMFFWQHLYPPQVFSSDDAPTPTGFLKVPGNWNKMVVDGKRISGDGFATYRLKVLLNSDYDVQGLTLPVSIEKKEIPYKALGLRFMFVQTAFTVYVNGQKVTSAGTVGISSENSHPQYLPHTTGLLTDSGQLDIVIHVSNFHHRKGGLESAILLGYEKDVRDRRQKSLYLDIFLFSSLIIMGFYYLGVFLLRTQERGPLYFSLLCFLMAVRSFVVGDYYILTVFPQIPWEFLLKIEYVTFLLPMMLFSLFLKAFYPAEINLPALKIFSGLTLLPVLIVLGTKVGIFSFIILPYQIMALAWGLYLVFVLVLAVKRQRRGSVLLLLGGLAFFISGLNDLAYNQLILKTGMFFPLGLFIFILFMSFVLAQRSAIAFSKVEQLSNNLEEEVVARTRQLSLSNNQLKRLLHILCHDLQNPLANVQGIIQLSRDDPTLFEELIPYASTSVDNGLAIIELVREIRVLEDKKLKLKLEDLTLSDLVTASQQMLSHQIWQKRVRIDIQIDTQIQVRVERTSFVNSVLNNILTNAIKFSHPGTSICIEASEQNGDVLLSVKDTGIGMPQNLLSDLFDLEKVTSRNGTEGEIGTGFGMPLVKTFIKAYHGTIEVFSNEEKQDGSTHGTEVRLLLKSASSPSSNSSPAISPS
ncbi:MAG: sensor histidine kinase [Deltaproteobacteria bacterium]|nr:sensor histidine kinase [Deltaproteobacteria bacterium]